MKPVPLVLFASLVLPFAAPGQGSQDDWSVLAVDAGFTTWDAYVIGYGGAGGDVEIPLSLPTPSGTREWNIIGVLSPFDYDAFDSGVGIFGDLPVTSVVIPPVGIIGRSAFANSAHLTNATINVSYPLVLEESAFRGCTALTSVTINIADDYFGGDGIEVTIGESAFAGCTSLTNIPLPKNVVSIKDNPFVGCVSLTGFHVDPLNTNYAARNGVLFNKDITELVAFPAGVWGEYTIPSTVTRIGASAFAGCNELNSVIIPNSVTNIGADAFRDCAGLTSVSIGEGVKTIGDRAFYECESLKSVIIPESVTNISSEALYILRLNSVLFKGDAPLWGPWSPFRTTRTTVYYLEGSEGWDDDALGGMPAEVFKPTALPPSMVSNAFHFRWTNTGAIPMNVQRATSPAGPWTVVSSNNATGEFVDASPPSGQAFYRAVLP